MKLHFFKQLVFLGVAFIIAGVALFQVFHEDAYAIVQCSINCDCVGGPAMCGVAQNPDLNCSDDWNCRGFSSPDWSGKCQEWCQTWK